MATSQTVLFLASEPRRLAALQEALYLAGHRFQTRLLREPAITEADLSGDVVVITAWPDPADTLQVVADTLAVAPQCPIVVLAETFTDATAFPLLSAGVRCLLTYEEARHQLARAVEAISLGGFWVARTLLAKFIGSVSETARRSRFALAHAELGPQDAALLEHLVQGLKDEDVAQQLQLTSEQVSVRIEKLLALFGVRRRADLILLASQHSSAPAATSGA